MLYKPSQINLENTLVDLSTGATTITCLVQGGTIGFWKAKIYDIDTNAELKVIPEQTLSTPVNSNETMVDVFDASSISSSNINVYMILQYSTDGITYVESFVTFFMNVISPVLTITVPATITKQEYTFDGLFTQSQSLGFEFWYYEYYDANDELLGQTVHDSSTIISNTFSGFLTGQTYKIKLFVGMPFETIFESVLYTFLVQYPIPVITVKPTVVQDAKTSSALVEWGELVQIIGTLESGTGDYVDNFIEAGNVGYHMSSDGLFQIANLDIPIDSTRFATVKFDEETYNGKIVEYVNTVDSSYIAVCRDNANSAFYKLINGVRVSAYATQLVTSHIFMIYVIGNSVVIKEYSTGKTTLATLDLLKLRDIDGTTLGELDGALDLTLLREIKI